ncbi:uncharacterized protein LOC120289179 [Eucalyptus grandis]|uniref:uncharacterized protein LOC120289179 n=1 Tax=Eucalyptus grandis TaxID=71139 RepID=UPI00192EFAE1|nr:uncharacterized protein LOC120289179 [Eucalyptus grandis]XP_039159650.1 uncharacterized protein LOC120289179 [Eucalyptus grandis]
MSKDSTVRSIVDHGSSAAPDPCSSQQIKLLESNNPVDSAENIREWVEARCPICMEHPHNAVILKCSSQGCQPYMCNTSHHHSNCLDQFNNRSPVPSPSIALPSSIVLCGSGVDSKLVCPFCRGKILGWDVREAARQYMDSKPRSCSLETCMFTGTYSELTKHARTEHPHMRPSEVDPSRQHDWMRLERETDLEDLWSTLESDLSMAEYLFEDDWSSRAESLFEDDWSSTAESLFEDDWSSTADSLFEDDWSSFSSWPLSRAEVGNAFVLQSLGQGRRHMHAGHLFMAENESLDPMLLLEVVWSFSSSRALSEAEIAKELLSQSLDRGHRQMRSRMPAQRTPWGRYGYESNGSVQRANFSATRCNAQRLRRQDRRWSASSNRW